MAPGSLMHKVPATPVVGSASVSPKGLVDRAADDGPRVMMLASRDVREVGNDRDDRSKQHARSTSSPVWWVYTGLISAGVISAGRRAHVASEDGYDLIAQE